VDARNTSELAALAARVEELSQACTRLSQENAQLHGVVAKLAAAPAPAPAPDAGKTQTARGPMSRRSLGKALGVAAAGVAGAAALTNATAGSAAAATGDAMLAGHAVNAEALTGVEYDGAANPGAIFGADDAGSLAGAALGAALSGHQAAILGNGTAAVQNGVFGNTAHPQGGDGVVGVNNSAAGGTGVHGIANNNRAKTVAVLGENPGGVAVQGEGGTVGVLGSGSKAGVQGTTGPNGVGVLGSGVIGVHGTGKTGLRGDGNVSNSVGVAGVANSAGGRGGVFAGNAAQLKLDPGSKSTHPASGQRGDLYADSKGRLWFCKGGTSWHQVA